MGDFDLSEIIIRILEYRNHKVGGMKDSHDEWYNKWHLSTVLQEVKILVLILYFFSNASFVITASTCKEIIIIIVFFQNK